MKTTIDIADDLIRRARLVQKREDITLRSLVEEGLRYVIDRHASATKKYRFKPVVVGEPYKPGATVMDVSAMIRDTYDEREGRMFKTRIAEAGARYEKPRKKEGQMTAVVHQSSGLRAPRRHAATRTGFPAAGGPRRGRSLRGRCRVAMLA